MTGFSISFLVKVKITAQFSQFKIIFSSVKFIPRLSNAEDASFTFRIMLFQFRAICARVQPVYLWIQARAARCISQMLPDKKKSIICQQVQHNFKQYITRLKKKLKLGQQEKNNYFSLKCAKSTEI